MKKDEARKKIRDFLEELEIDAIEVISLMEEIKTDALISIVAGLKSS